jgi:hypothetical protein
MLSAAKNAFNEASRTAGDAARALPGRMQNAVAATGAAAGAPAAGATAAASAQSVGMNLVEKVVFVILVMISLTILFSIGASVLSTFLQPTNPFVIEGLLTATNGRIFNTEDPKNGVIIQRSNNETTGMEFSWSVWINVTDLSAGSNNYMHVFSKGDNSSLQPTDDNGIYTPNNAPGVYLSKQTNQLLVIMNTFEVIEERIEVGNIPLGKWVHILVRLEGQYLDVYINGIIAKRKQLLSVPKQNNGKIYVAQNGGFNGFLSDLRYYSRALTPGDIVAIVNQGPNLKLSKDEQKGLKSQYPNYLALDWYFQSAQAPV